MVLQVVVPNSAGKKTCYHQLESASKGGTATTNRVEWFLLCLGRSIAKADAPVARIVEKFRIWEEIKARKFNDCQRLMINRLLDGFEGKLHTSKWATITKCSPDTALRDIQPLIDEEILEKEPAGGRSTTFRLKKR